MEQVKSKFTSGYRTYFIVIGIYFIFLAGILIINGYKNSFLILNSHHIGWLDWPMFIITHLGDSMILASVLSLIIVWKRPQLAVILIITVIVTGLFGQMMKGLFFEGWDRPLRIFNESEIVHTLPNYRLFHNSFPSGHSITAMSLLTTLIWCIRPNSLIQTCIALLAIIITYSRIYLGVHFPGDVLAGSLTGIVLTMAIIPFLIKKTYKLSYSKTFKIIIALLSITFLTLGVWILRVYYPLI